MRWTQTSVETGALPERADPGLRIDPVPVGRRRPTGGLVAAAAIAVVLGVALAKPWAAPGRLVAALPSHAVAALPSEASDVPVVEAARPPGAPDPTGVEPTTRAIRIADWPRLSSDVDHLAGQPIVTDRDLAGSGGDGTCGGSARITPFDQLFAIAATPGERVADVRLFAIDSISRPDIPTRISTDRPGPLDGRSLDGLTLVVLPPGGIAARQYAVIADMTSAAGPGRLTYTICVG